MAHHARALSRRAGRLTCSTPSSTGNTKPVSLGSRVSPPESGLRVRNAKEDVKMRKTLIAMLGLAALVVWALPAFAGTGDPPYARELIPLDARAGALGALAKTGNNPGATLS